ncbi:MAG: Ig-like domain-containing protein [bacterium]|nr:Ig-like domain-containing protein [bacterium]
MKTTRLVLTGFFMSVIAFGGFFVSVAYAAITTLTVDEPTAGDEWRGTQEIEWSFTGGDPGDTVNIAYSTDDFASQAVIVLDVAHDSSPYIWDTSGFPESTNFKIRFIDDSLFVYDTSDAFTVDNTDPVTTLTIDAIDGLNGWHITIPAMLLSCADTSGAGCNKTYYRWDGGGWVDNSATPVVASEGSHLLEYYSDDQAVDALGAHNEEAVQSLTVKVDTTDPMVAVTSTTLDGAYNEPDAINVTLTFSEVVTTTDTITITLETGATDRTCIVPIMTNATVGTCTYTVQAGDTSGDLTTNSIAATTGSVFDIAGNIADLSPTSNLAATSVIVIDTTAPDAFTVGTVSEVGGTIVAGWWNSTNTSITVDVPVDSDSSLTGGTIQLQAEADGTYENVGPAYTILVGDLSTTKTLSLTAAELEAIAGFSDGDEVQFRAVITDLAENATTGTESSDNTDVDQTAPSVDAGIDKEVKVMTMQDATTSDGGSTISTHLWSQEGGSGTITFGTGAAQDTDVSADADDSYTIRLTVTDVAGNSAFNEATFVWDTTVPTLASVTPVPNPTNDTTPSYTFSASHVGWLSGHTGGAIGYVGACGSGDLITAAAGDNTTTYTVPANVTYTDCDITVTDAAGNVSSTLEVNDFEVDTIAALISSVTTEDTDFDGSIDTSTLVFDDEINDSTILLTDFAIEGTNPTAFSTGTMANDATIVLTFGTQVAGTEAKTLDYTSSADDLAGNDIAPFAELSVDEAGPVLLSARTITTTSIEATFSEDLNGATVTATDFTITSLAHSIDSATEGPDDGTVIIDTTLLDPMDTDETPTVNYVGTIKDLPGNTGPNGFVVAVDGIAPVLTSVSISSSNAKDGTAWAKEGDTVTVSFTASEELDEDPIVTIDGNPADAVTNPSGDNWTATRVMQAGDTEGVVTFTIDFEDVAVPTHNLGTQVTAITTGTNITYDETVPEVDAGPNQEVNAIVSQDAITDDPGAFASGIDTWLWEKITGPGAVVFGSATVEDTTIVADTDGVYIIRLTVEDEAGNVDDDEIQLIWDTLAPRLEYTVPAHGSTGIGTDAGTLEAYFREMNHGANPENLTLEDDAFVFLEDTAGNDMHTGVAVQGGDGTSNILEIDYSALTAGTTYCLTLMAGAVSDAAGNVTTLDIEGRCFTAAVDTIVPVINSLSASSVTAGGATITAETNENASCSIASTDQAYGTMTAFDATGGVTSHTTTLSGLSEQTQYTYYVRCADTAGNTMTTSGTVNFLTAVLDGTAPSAPIITTTETTVNSDFYTIAGTVAADAPSDSTRTVTVYNGANAAGALAVPVGQTAWAIIVPLTQNATSTFSAKAVDASGNESDASNSVDIGESDAIGVDSTAPEMPVITTDDATVDADTYALSGTLADDGDIRTLFIHGGSIDATVQLPAGETAWTVTVSLEQGSANSFTAQAADEAGNMSAETVPVVITETPEDGTAPTVSVSASAVTTSSATIDVSVDETAVCRIGPADVAFASLPTALSAGTPDTDHEYLPSGLAAGTLYNYYVRCEDDVGNISNSAHVSFATLSEADEDGPDAPFLTTADAITDADTYTIAGTVADDGGARTVALYNGATLAGTTIVAAGQTAWALFVPLTQETDNVFTAIATDEAGNVSDTSGDVTITEETAEGDTDAPDEPAITTGDDTIDADTYAITGTASDDGGTRTITVYRNATVVGSVSLPAGETEWSFVSSLLQNEENDFTAYSTDVAGNTSDASNTVTIEEEDADDTAPEVLSTNPEDEDGDVSVGVSPSVTFDEALDPTTVSSDTVMLIDGDDNQVEATVSLVEGGTRTIINPVGPLEYDSDYYIVITEDITDLAGNPFGSDGEYELAEFTTEEEPVVTLAVTGVDAIDTFATDDDTFANGWSWTFHVTVPTAETTFAMKFSDFISGANTIAAANNIRYFTAQASANDDEASAVTIVGADAYPAGITLDSDIDSSTAGRQIEVTVQAKVPAGSAGGSYSTSYGVATS